MLEAIGLVVRDPRASAAFYAHLGLAFEEAGGPEHLEARTETGLRVMLDSVDLMKKLRPDWHPPEGGPAHALAFRQPTPPAVDALYERLLAHGGRGATSPWDAFWGQRYATVLDPDGHPLDLFADLSEG